MMWWRKEAAISVLLLATLVLTSFISPGPLTAANGDQLPLSYGVDNTNLTWTTGGDADWFTVLSTDYWDSDAAQSGDIGNNQSSWLQTTVTGPATVSFQWKVSSEQGDDILSLSVDGSEKASISGTTALQQFAYPLPSGSHTLKWEYSKDVLITTGSDCGWVDRVQVFRLGEAVDNTSLPWTTGGDAEWFSQSSTYHSGGDALQSGDIGDDQESWLETTVTGPATVSFYWKVRSECPKDWLIFYIDDVNKAAICSVPDMPWAQRAFVIPSGSHSLKWVYQKDSSLSWESDCGWLDDVRIDRIAEAVDNDSLLWTTGGDAGWFEQSSVYHFDGDAAQSGDISQGESSWLETTVTGPVVVSFYWKSSGSLIDDYLRFSIDGTEQARIEGDEEWQQQVHTLESGSHTLRWEFFRGSWASFYSPNGWIDKVQVTRIGWAVDNTALEWRTGGDADWFDQSSVCYFDGDAAQSGDIGHRQESWLETTVDGPVIVSFYWKVSSESCCDYLRFEIDGVEKDRIKGEVDWQQKVYAIAPGSHSVKWRYEKDGSVDSGSDCGWVDKLEIFRIGEAVDNTSLTWTTGGDAIWFDQSSVSHFDGDAAQSGSIGDDQVSWLETTVEGPAIVSFYWKVSSNHTHDWIRDHLAFYIGGTAQASISGDVGWQQKVYVVESGSHTLQWIYDKDDILTSGSDCGWVDKVEVIRIGEAVDNTDLTWTTGGEAIWFDQSSVSYSDGDAAQSGDIGDDQSSWVETTVSGPTTVSFYWKISSEQNWDFLRFYVDGVEEASISGSVNWQSEVHPIPSGTHTLKWEYEKDGSGSAGDDGGWLDKVELIGLAEAVDNTSLAWTTGGDSLWRDQSSVYYFDGDAARCGYLFDAYDVSWLETTVAGPATLSFYWKVSSRQYYDWLRFYVDGISTASISGDQDWHERVYLIPSGNHTLRWEYERGGGDGSPSHGGWIDKVRVIRIGEAVENASLTWTTGGDADWFDQSSVAYFDGDAAQSGNVGDNQSSWVETTVTGPATVSFYWKASSEWLSDFLRFKVDGVEKVSISGDVAWQQEAIVIPSGSHTLRWEYEKNGSLSSGSDCGWIDKVEIVRIGEAVDNTSLAWTTGGDADWFDQTSVSFFGGDAAQSGDITDDGTSWMETTVMGPATISFYWEVSSESGWDYLRFEVDGVEKDEISGEVDWQQKVYAIAPGSHSLKWLYEKDDSVSSGSDCGWVDKVEVITLASAVDIPYLAWTSGGDAEWFDQSSTYYFDEDAAQSGGIGDNGSSWMETTVTGPATLSFYWKVSSESDSDFLRFFVDGAESESISGEVDWQQETFELSDGIYTLRWEYSKNSSGSTGDDCGWVDRIQLIRIGEAVDNNALTWAVGGDANWFDQSSVSFFDGDAAQSGHIGDNGTSWMETTVTGPATLSFYWKVSSEETYDFMRFYIDGVEQHKISGEVDWQQQVYVLESGSHTLKWIYDKDVYWKRGYDCGWVDRVQIIRVGEAVGDSSLAWTAGGDGDWFDQSAVYYVDGSAAQSGDIDHSQSSWVETSVEGPAIVAFYWKVSSEAGVDFLHFIVDGSDQSSISGEVDWQQEVHSIPSGNHTLRWEYAKNSSESVGQDCGWIDNIRIIRLGEAVDNTSVDWTTGGDEIWFDQSDVNYFDGDAAQSGDIGDSQSSWVETTVTGPATVYFYWKVSSETDGDFLQFFMDESEQSSISGQLDWQQEVHGIPSGTHTLKWQYAKNGSTSAGSDCGWIDQVEILPAPKIAASPETSHFGEVEIWDVSAPRAFTVRNDGDADLVITKVWITGEDASDFVVQSENCTGGTVAPGATCTVAVTCSPTSAEEKTAYLSIESNDPDTPILNIPLSGTGTLPSERYFLDINVFPFGWGKVRVDPAQPAEGYYKRTPVRLTAVPSDYHIYIFEGWSGGLSGTDSSVTISINSDISLIAHFGRVRPIQVHFEANRTWCSTGDEVAFTCAVDGGVPPYTYAWDFGDGEVSSEQNPVHSYASMGTYTVSVQVVDARGKTYIESSHDYITVDYPRIWSTYTSVPPSIDGTWSQSEWGDPVISKMLSYEYDDTIITQHETHLMQVYFMHDSEYLYIAVTIAGEDFESDTDECGEYLDELEIFFDSNNNGVIEPGEDNKEFENLIYQDWYYDGYYGNAHHWRSDSSQDGEGEAQYSGGGYIYEFRIPLSSGDAQDISITPDSTVGIYIDYREYYPEDDPDPYSCSWSTAGHDGWPDRGGRSDGSAYGKLTLGDQPPEQPSNHNPTEGSGNVILTPTLVSSAFSDPDAGDTHAYSQWQIREASGDYSNPIFDSGIDGSNLTRLPVPLGTLDAATTYYWRVRHRDGSGVFSPWSEETSFTTATAFYTLAANIGSGGGGEVSLEPSQPVGGYVVGTEVTVTALAGEGYEFDQWSGSISGAENPITIAMDSSKTVTANFFQVTYNLIINVDPDAGGTVALEPSQPVDGYAAGTEVTLTTAANDGYAFAQWGGDLPGTQGEVTISMNADKEITAAFTQITYVLKVEVSPGNGGDIMVNDSTPSSYPATYTYAYGTSVELEALPASGYSLDGWSGDLSGSQTGMAITIDSNKVAAASFSPATYTLTVNADPGQGGDVLVDGTTPSSYPASYTLVHGESISVEAVPASGYSFSGWSGHLSGQDNPTTVTMDSNTDVTASFSIVVLLSADFSASVTQAVVGQAIEFTDTSSGDVTSWSWDFDNDGRVDSTEQNPSYVYATPGDYTVALTISNPLSSDAEKKVGYISVIDALVRQTIVPGTESTVETPDGRISIEFPAGAVTSETEVIISELLVSDAPSAPSGFRLGDTYFSVDGITSLAKEITITVGYSDQDVAAAGGDPSQLTLSRYDEAQAVWVVLPTTVDTQRQTLTATTGRLSDWIVMAQEAIPSPIPNGVSPSSGKQGKTISVTITGSDFSGATAVAFGAGITVNSFTVDSSSQITASITIADQATTGSRDISVTTSGGTGTLSDGFTVTEKSGEVGGCACGCAEASTSASELLVGWGIVGLCCGAGYHLLRRLGRPRKE